MLILYLLSFALLLNDTRQPVHLFDYIIPMGFGSGGCRKLSQFFACPKAIPLKFLHTSKHLRFLASHRYCGRQWIVDHFPG